MKKEKEYIMDDNIIRKCQSNEAKMNVFEYIKYFYGWKKMLPFSIGNDEIELIIQALSGFVMGLFSILVILLYIPGIALFPIIRIIMAFIKIQKAKTQVELESKHNNN